MKAYTFFKIDQEIDVPSFEIADFDSRSEARGYAQKLLGATRYRAIEIWDGEDAERVERRASDRAPSGDVQAAS